MTIFMDHLKEFEIVAVDFRDQLGPPPTPFKGLAITFIQDACVILSAIPDTKEKSDKAVAITNLWLEMVGVRDLFDEGYMFSHEELADLSGMSLDEIYLLDATAYAEILGLDITGLEKAASHCNIYGSNYPFARAGGESFDWGGDLNAAPDDPS